MPLSRRRRGGDEGSAALELAVIGPSLFVLIFFVLQVALYFYGRSVALQSARDGVSQLRLAPDAASFDVLEPRVTSSVEDFAGKVGNGALNGAHMTATHDGPYDRVTVTVKGDAISLVPWMTWTITQSASGTVEKFRVG
jgi:Flp pilus assembly protein TadG